MSVRKEELIEPAFGVPEVDVVNFGDLDVDGTAAEGV